MADRTRGHWAFALTSASVLWALLLLPAAFVLPAYGTGTVIAGAPQVAGHAPAIRHGSATLIAVNGASLRLFILLALPAVLAVIAWAGLRQRCARGKRAGASLATAAIVILAALTLLTAFSIGSAILPALALLVAGRSLTPTGPLDPAL